jgi:hypothetical protein
MRFQHAIIAASGICLLAAATTACAQDDEPRVRLSQKAIVSQTIDRTVVTIEYGRPAAKGRELFGGIVAFGKEWTPGANEATTFETNAPLRIAGHDLPAGKYSLWTVPGETEWTLIFSRRADAFHTRYPRGEDELRVTIRPSPAPHVELLTFTFPVVGPDAATLQLHWGTTALDIPIALIAGG